MCIYTYVYIYIYVNVGRSVGRSSRVGSVDVLHVYFFWVFLAEGYHCDFSFSGQALSPAWLSSFLLRLTAVTPLISVHAVHIRRLQP